MWLEFFKSKDHAIIKSANVVPENDASVLFINSGVQPLAPFVLGQPHPAGTRLANIQKCIRTGDIDDVGDSTHLTFFEMLGNWSLGDYFKREKIAWSYEFATSKKYLGIPSGRIAVTCFAGDDVAPRDTESAQLWLDQGIPSERIFFLGRADNWWQLPNGTGPCGPCSEIYFIRDTRIYDCPDETKCDPSCDCGKYVEIGNDVFMEFIIETEGDRPKQSPRKNVDTGYGLERVLCLVNGYNNVYESELFRPAISIVENASGKTYTGKEISGERNENETAAFRIVVEHTRSSMIIIGDGVVPSNTGQGYVLRRLIRRALRMAMKLSAPVSVFPTLISNFVEILGAHYPNLEQNKDSITQTFMAEAQKFEKTLSTGLREFDKVVSHLKDKNLSGKTAFRLYETYGFPIELTLEMAKERGLDIDMNEYTAAKEKHATASQTASAGAFKGGMADTSGNTINLHTATHLLLAALRKQFGDTVNQKGSNITPERLRFDFVHGVKMTPEEIEIVENQVNEWIDAKLDVNLNEMSIENAKATGAIGVFGDKYGEVVKVYSIGGCLRHNDIEVDTKKSTLGKSYFIIEQAPISIELCGGPHVENTSELGKFKIQKEESAGAGIRRIKATLS